MKETEREKTEKVEKAKENRPKPDDPAFGRLLLVSKTNLWCYVFAYLALIVVWFSINPLMAYVEPVLENAASQLKSLRPEFIKMAADKFVLFVRCVAVFSTLAYHLQAYSLQLEVYENGLRCLRGLFNREVLSISFEKVRGTSRAQVPWQLWLGYGTLRIDYGSAGGPLLLEGIDKPEEIEKKLAIAQGLN